MKAFFTPRPPVFEAVRWDGSNLEEVQEFLDPNSTGLVIDNSDGTLTLNTPAPQVIRLGDWVSLGPIQFGPFQDSTHQLVTEPGLHRYRVEQA